RALAARLPEATERAAPRRPVPGEEAEGVAPPPAVDPRTQDGPAAGPGFRGGTPINGPVPSACTPARWHRAREPSPWLVGPGAGGPAHPRRGSGSRDGDRAARSTERP